MDVGVQRNGISVIGGPMLFTRPACAGYAEETLNFTSLDAGTYRLLVSQIAGDADLVDHFALNGTVTTSVPEPSTLVPAAIGVLALGGYAWRRRPTRVARPRRVS